MASTYPRFGYDNVFLKDISATSEDSAYPVERLINNRISSKYKAAGAVDPIYINSYPVSGQLLLNWYFSEDASGTSITPTSWTLIGSPSTYNLVDTAGVPKIGANVVYMISAAGGDGLSQVVDCPVSALGKQVTFGVWIKNASSTMTISVSDGSTTWTSSANAGGSAWEWLTITSGAISAAATELTVTIDLNSATVAFIDGALLTVAATAVETPHAQTIDYMALAGHNLLSAGLKVTLEKSTDNFVTPVTVQAVTPTTDGTLFKSFTQTSSAFLRLKIEAVGTYFQRPEIAIASVGAMLQMPEHISAPFDPLAEDDTIKSASAFTGVKLGVDVRSTNRKFSIPFRLLRRDFITAAAWQAFKSWAIDDRKPFFFAHNEGLYPLEVFFVNMQDSFKYSVPMRTVPYTEGITLQVEGVVR